MPVAASEGEATSFLVAVCSVFFFFSFDATAQQRLDGFSPNLHQKTSLQCYSLTVVPPKCLGAQNVHFWSENSDTDDRGAQTRRNSGKTKTTGITTIWLPSRPRLVKFGSGHLSYRGLISCA